MKQLIINNIQVIDVETGKVETKSVVAENGLVTEIVAGDAGEDAAKVLDGSGLYLMPGFINCHTHLGWDGSKTDIMLQSKNDSDAISAFKYAVNMKKCLDVGLTAVRDLGMNLSNIYAKQAVDSGIIESPRLYISGQAIMATGGHTWWCGVEADGPWEIRKAIRQQKKAGAQVIKIMASGSLPEYTMEELYTIVDESHALGLKVAAHATFGSAIERVVEAGVDSIEHGGDMTDALIEKIKEKNIPIIPTLSAVFIQAREGLEKGMPEAAVLRRRRQVANKDTWDGLKRAGEAGVTFCFGTDAGSPLVPHDRIVDELLAMKEIGITKSDLYLLQCMTVNAGKLIGDAKLGLVGEGKYADFVITDKNPLEDITNISALRYVVQNGKLVRSYSRCAE